MRHSGHAACGTNGGHLLFGRLLGESAQRLRRLGQALAPLSLHYRMMNRLQLVNQRGRPLPLQPRLPRPRGRRTGPGR